MAKAAGSIPAGRTINGRESEWRGPRPITGWQKVRILPLSPTTRTKQNERDRQTLRMCDRSGERARLLIWWRASAQRGFESRHILQTCSKSWTSYRSGRTGRTLNPMAHAHRRFESCLVLQHQLPCYASGEAARLSIERDGFESRTGRQLNITALVA